MRSFNIQPPALSKNQSNLSKPMSLQTMPTSDLLTTLYQDFVMLQDGTWVPDRHSCDASLDVIEEIAKRLSVDLHGSPIDVESPTALDTFCKDNPGDRECRIYDV